MKITAVVFLLSFSVLANAAAIAAPIPTPSTVAEATPLPPKAPKDPAVKSDDNDNDVRGEVEDADELATDEVLDDGEPWDDDEESVKVESFEVDLDDNDHGITTRGNVEDITILERDVIPAEVEKRDSLLERGLAMLDRRETVRAATDRLEFRTSMASFLSAKKRKSPGALIWTDDGCSKSPDRPSGFNFLHSCQRHDFGYRNYKKQGRFTSANRKKIDDKLKSDLYAECNRHGLIKRTVCKRIADIYYHTVRTFGGL